MESGRSTGNCAVAAGADFMSFPVPFALCMIDSNSTQVLDTQSQNHTTSMQFLVAYTHIFAYIIILSPSGVPQGGQAPENILGTQGFEWFWAQWNQGAWGWCVGYLQLPWLPQIPRSQGYGPQDSHDPWYRGGWVPWKHFHQESSGSGPDNQNRRPALDQPTTQKDHGVTICILCTICVFTCFQIYKQYE